MERVEKFVREVYSNLVEEDEKSYRDLFNNTNIDDDIIQYWKSALTLYKKLVDEDKEIFFNILRQVRIDTISGVFGIIDGCISIDYEGIEPRLFLDNQDTENELLERFLEYDDKIGDMEEQNKK